MMTLTLISRTSAVAVTFPRGRAADIGVRRTATYLGATS